MVSPNLASEPVSTPLAGMAVVLALGIPAIVVFGNLPEWLERLLRPVVITLDVHLLHHSIEFSRVNWNYGAVLSIWDRLFGTYAQISRAKRDGLVFGVRELPRRDCLKPSADVLTAWRLGRAGVQEAA